MNTSRILRAATTLGAREHPSRRAAMLDFVRGAGAQPANASKRRHLRKLFVDRGHRVFVESGTYRGDTTAVFAPIADEVHTVELAPALFTAARERFAAANNVTVHQGDATDVVPEVVAGLSRPPLIWLDGHYSGGETAQGEEVEPALTILRRLGPLAPAGTTVVVDDLRLFGADATFPTLEALVVTAREQFAEAVIRTGLDALVIEA